MEYETLVLVFILAIPGWVSAYFIYRELAIKEKFIQDLTQENQKLASKLLREGVQQCVKKRKSGTKKQTNSDGQT
jgi:hypothetical protein